MIDNATPRKGDPIKYFGRHVGTVLRIDGNLCWVASRDGGESAPFIWRFKDGLNALHDWPNKPVGRNAPCPGALPRAY